MLKVKLIGLFTAFILSAFSSTAAAEMEELIAQARSEFAQLPLILKMCTLPENHCGLSEYERRMLIGLLRQGFDIHSPNQLEFHDSATESYFFYRSEKILSVHSARLKQQRFKNLFIGYARYVIGDHLWIDLIAEKIFEVQPEFSSAHCLALLKTDKIF